MVVEEMIIAEQTIDRSSSEVFQDGRQMLRYVLTAAGVMGLLYLAPFFLAQSPLYDRVNPSFYARPLNYAFETAGQNADVVIFGDSTALLGINPRQMSTDLGVKVLNLVNTQPSLVVNDDMSLRHYLKANHAPKLLIFYFAPWDFDYGHNDFNSRPTYEGEELLLRHGSSQEIGAFVAKHPEEVALFPMKFYGTAWQFTMHRVPKPNQAAQLTATLGHIDNTDPSVLRQPCEFPQYLIDNIRFSWVHDLAARYQTPATQVLLYVAPVPACKNVSRVVEQSYDRLPASPPRQVPPEYFMSDVRFIHPRASAVPEITENLIQAVRPVLASAR